MSVAAGLKSTAMLSLLLALCATSVLQVSALTWRTTKFLFVFGDSYTTTGFNISAGIDSPVPGFVSISEVLRQGSS
jgi:hypothetical protein